MSVYEKLIKVQVELKAPKNQRNNFGNYNYRSCEDILESVKPILDKYKSTIYINDVIELIGNRTYVKAIASFVDVETGEFVVSNAYAREEETKKGMDASQITGATSSYARKYALNGLLLIDDTKDADATNTQDKEYASNKNTKPKFDEKEKVEKVLGQIAKSNTTTEIKPTENVQEQPKKPKKPLTEEQLKAINVEIITGNGTKTLGDLWKNDRETYEALRPVASKVVKDAMAIIDSMVGKKNG